MQFQKYSLAASCRRLLVAGLVFFMLVPGNAYGQSKITIYRDAYGVPSVAADRLADAVYGFGYATARDNAVRMARNYKQARGRVGEIDGKSALLSDGFLRSLGIEEYAEKEARRLTGETAVLLKAYCGGANRALAEQKGHLPEWVEPVTPVDILSLAQLINSAFALEEIAAQLLPGAGSNQFALAPGRTSTGHPILSMDPHLDWSGMLSWYEFSLYSKEFSFHGITLPGLPFGSMGHTDRVAWSMTNNNPVRYNFYSVKPNPDNPKQYNYHGEWRDYKETTVELRYRENGELKSRMQKNRRTAWGPMVPFRSQAISLPALGSFEMLAEALQMARATDAKSFREALKLRGISMFNIVYADVKGSIGYQYNGRIPRRDESIDWRKLVDGSSPATKLGGLLTLDELPHIENPKSQLLANGNSAPWLTPVDSEIRSTGWPNYITSYGHTTRYDRLAALLAPAKSVTPELAKRIATDVEVPYARKLVPALRASFKKNARLYDNSEQADLTQEALKVLEAWDKRAEVGSRGCGLYLFWYRGNKMSPTWARKAATGEAWSEQESVDAIMTLSAGAKEMKRLIGALDTPWGEMHYAERGAKRVPVSGFGYVVTNRGINEEKTATVAPNWGEYREGRIACTGGSSFRMIVDLTPNHVRSWSVLPYGDLQVPGSPHFDDQMSLFAVGGYKETYFGVANIAKHATSKQILERK